MTAAAWAQVVVLIAALALTAPLLGRYIADVFGGGPARGDRAFAPVERVIYRVIGVDERREQPWGTYARSVLAFSATSIVVLYAIQRLQGFLPLNPAGHGAVPAFTAFNTAVSFTTNTNWQSYAGESTMSHLTQMTGLAVQNFVSASVGLAVAIALVRGLTRQRSNTIGNFWVDLVRGTVRVLLPIAVVAAVVFLSRGVIQNFDGGRAITTLDGASQVIPGGPVASQEAIKIAGTNGGGFFNANSAHPFENPDGLIDLIQIYLMLLVPFALPFTFGRMAQDRRQGLAVLAAMVLLWVGGAAAAMHFETTGSTALDRIGVDQTASDEQAGGNLEGKEVRFGPAASALYAASTTGTSTGAVNASHDSFTPAGGAVPLVNMMLGEVSPGGVGAGLYGMLVFAILAVFIAGLMVGRTPEYLGKKIQAAEMKLVTLYILAVPVVVLTATAVSISVPSLRSAIANPGPHGLTEMIYAFTSAGNNNGSAFGGLTVASPWYDVATGIAMLCGRFLLIVPVLGVAGAMARKQRSAVTAGTLPTGTPLFAGLLTGVVLIVVGLTFFPSIALGPIVEHLGS